MSTATIFDIQRFSLNDGGGIRTIVFFKGCPLRCLWCSNPESQKSGVEVLFWRTRCIGCGKCAENCPEGLGCNGVNTEKCKQCRICADTCVSRALKIAGTEMEIDEVLQKIEKDVVFYGFSSGGVTFSGGEPLMHWQFAAELASELQSRLIDTAIETTGYAKWESAWEVFQHCDRILYDIKVLDSRTHRKLTGVDNALILENAARLAETNKEVIYRIPLIKDINDSIEHTSAFIALAKQNHVLEINLLPYHEYGKPKYDALGKEYSFKGCAPSDEHVKELTNRIENSGLTVSVGG